MNKLKSKSIARLFACCMVFLLILAALFENTKLEADGATNDFRPIWPTTYGHIIHGLDAYFNDGSHNGIDILPDGSNYQTQDILAVADGTVYATRNKCTHANQGAGHNCPDTWGNYVCIKHTVNGNTFFSVYAHLNYDSINVSNGSTVKAGQKIAKMGSSGGSTAYHLHLELWKGSYSDKNSQNAYTFQYFIDNPMELNGARFHKGLATYSAKYKDWIKDNCTLDGSYYLYNGKHTKQFYPTHCTIQLSKSGYVKSMPCSADTDPESENIERYTAGGTYTAIGLCRNDASETGNLWYKVVAKTGEIGYLYAGDTKLGASNVTQSTGDLKVTGVAAPTQLKKGDRFSIKGVIKTDYQKLTKVGAVVINTATGKQETGTVLSVDATSYDLLNSNVDYAVEFNNLPVGNYEYRIVASVKSYYAESATKEATFTTAEIVLHKSTFSVVASTSCSHSYNTSVTAPTCTAEGYTTYTCKSCGYSYKGSYTAAKGHSYGNWVTVTAATCTKAGQEKSTCSSCGNVKTQTVAAGGHQYAANKVAATCTEYAKTVYTCSGCGDSYTKYDESQYSQWSTTKPSGIADKWVESRTEYRYRTKEYKTGSTNTMDGWTLKDTTTQWSDYGAWSGWSDTAVSASDTVKVETRKVYAYYFYNCPSCGAHMHGYGSCYTWAGGCGKATNSGHWNQIWSTTSWDDAGLKDWHGTGKYYAYIDGQLVFKHTSGGSKTQYRSCTRTLETVYNFWRWSNWSTWQTTAVEANNDRAVETRTTYRYLNSGLAAHTEVIDKAVAATCTASGKTQGKHCSVCNVVITAQQTVPATGHSYTYKSTKAPTTSATGTLTGTCSKCSGTTTVTLPKLNTTDYTYQVTKAATCTATGTGSYTWKTTTYGSFSFSMTIAATGHTEVNDAAVAATCTTAGKTAGKHCSVCNVVITAQQTVPATGHSYTYKSTKAPTTSATGTLTGTCSKCSGTTTVTLPKLNTTDYTYQVTKAATCTATGTGKYTWKTTTYGSFSFSVTLAAKGHTEVIDKAVAATCTTAGKTEGKHCSVCNAILTAQQTIAAKGHTEVIDKAVAATCTTAGKTEGKHCSVCNTVIVAQQTIPAINHNYAITPEIKPTCTETGMTSGVQCTDCGTYLLTGNEIPALGHTVVTDSAVDATCNTPGKTEGSHCSVCNQVLVAQQEIPVISHSYAITPEVKPTCTESGKTSGVQCTLCKEYLLPAEEVPALGHTEVTDAAVVATCTESGLTEGKHCSTCNAVMIAQEQIPATGHNYENGICTGCGIVDASGVRITLQPASQTVPYGESAVFTVAAEGNGLSCRWQYSKDGGVTWINATTAMAGYNTQKLTLAATKARNGYQLRCKITDENGNVVYSDAALLTVKEPEFAFAAHPADETVKLGNRAAFTVAAEGECLVYQWQYQMVENGPWWNCTPYTMGYNTTELNVIAAEKRQGFLYRCRVTDASGNKFYSNSAELTVDIPASYAVLSQPQDAYVMAGNKTTFHIATQGEGLTYQWEYHKGVDKSGPEYYWIAMGSTTGCKTDTLTIAGISGSTNRNGWAYRCVVTDKDGYIYTTDYAFLHVTTAEIITQPQSVTAAVGSKAVFTVETEGEVASYQWQYSKDSGKSWYNSSAATQGYNTDTLTVGATAARNGFMYRCVIIDSEGNRIETDPVTLTVQ